MSMWAEEPVAVCALWWRWQVSTGLYDGARLGPSRYREVGYQDLVDDPEARLRELTDFLHLPDAAEMAAYRVRRTSHRPGLSAMKARLPPTAGLRNWRHALPQREQALFEALAADLLAELATSAPSTPSPRRRPRSPNAAGPGGSPDAGAGARSTRSTPAGDDPEQ